ncbi:DUF4214 domain-containing protein [Iamia majanohamensis]|uniref:DUF4214 domain-containing protein n=1 Tax=Iamia majanohamensis TaxID=467976 RepID=A0AAE9Y5M6_9ACTN|nr:DUF4214 domain-containing protein [Iamia majanohamensis]WCO67024.1 DUF4214 domain-containing protein [Iamia majanohamensis]
MVGVLVALGALVACEPTPGGPSGSAPSTPTYLHMVSSGDDSVGLGGGRMWTYVPAEADISVTASGGDIDVHVDGDTWWDVVLRPTSPQESVTPGRHEGTARAVVSGDGRGCGEEHTRGWYEVDEVAYEGGELVLLAVRFAQWCAHEDETSALHGEVRYDASAPTPGAPTPVGPPPASFWRPPAAAVPAGAERNHLVMESDRGDFVGQGRTHAYTGFDAQLFQGALTLHHRDLSWHVALRPSNRAAQGVEAGFYPHLLRDAFPNPARGGFSVGGEARGCNKSTSDVVVDEVDARGGTLTDIALRFEQHCEHETPALRGQAVWQEPVAPGTVGPPAGVTAEDAGATATVRWIPPSTTGAGPVTGYEVIAYRDGTAVGPTTSTAAGATSTQVPITPGHRWTFKVAAINAAGTGLRSSATAPVGAPPLDLGPFATLEALVAQQYRDFLGRPPTATEVRDAVAQIGSGRLTPASWIAGLSTRPEWGGRRAPIIRLYTAAFVRTVDDDGLDYWSERRRTGTSLSAIAQGFAGSPEFRTRYGTLSDSDFVDRIYRNVLGRGPDPGGFAYWTDRLGSGTPRGAVLLAFSEASENRARRAPLVAVTLLAAGMLDRAPTVDEVNIGGNVEGVALHYLTRAEYRERLS